MLNFSSKQLIGLVSHLSALSDSHCYGAFLSSVFKVYSTKKTKQDEGCGEGGLLMWNKSYHCVIEPSDTKLHSSCTYKRYGEL